MAPPAVESRFGSHLITGLLLGFGLCLLALALLDRPTSQSDDPGPGATVTGSTTTTDQPPASGLQTTDGDADSSGDSGFLAWRDLTLSDLVTGLVGICSAVLGVLNYRRSRRAEEAEDEEWRQEEAYL